MNDKAAEVMNQIAKFAHIALQRLNGSHEYVMDYTAGHRQLPPKIGADGKKYQRVELDGTFHLEIKLKPNEVKS